MTAPKVPKRAAMRATTLRPVFQSLDLRQRGAAAGVHALISAAVGASAAFLVFGLWYPGVFRLLAGGRDLFLLITSVDIVLGPLLTFVVFNRSKGWPRLRRDLAVIALIQLAALAYGLHTVYIARPVAMVFEVDRFRLITANDVPEQELRDAPEPYARLSWTGPSMVSTRKPTFAENTDALFKAMAGLDVGNRPRFWQPYDLARPDALKRSRPISALLNHYADRAADLGKRLAAMPADQATSRFLPTVARGDWVAVIDTRGTVLGYLPVDGFF